MSIKALVTEFVVSGGCPLSFPFSITWEQDGESHGLVKDGAEPHFATKTEALVALALRLAKEGVDPDSTVIEWQEMRWYRDRPDWQRTEKGAAASLSMDLLLMMDGCTFIRGA